MNNLKLLNIYIIFYTALNFLEMKKLCPARKVYNMYHTFQIYTPGHICHLLFYYRPSVKMTVVFILAIRHNLYPASNPGRHILEEGSMLDATNISINQQPWLSSIHL